MKTIKNTLRFWLLENSYEDVAQLIEEIMLHWKDTNNKQRRNWWDILAGGKNGKSRNIAGKQIPVLRIAQIRKGVRITDNAICRNENEKLNG
jgi:hypothetical protein